MSEAFVVSGGIAPRYRIESLNQQHARHEFTCGKDPLDRFIRDQGFDWAGRNLARVCVLVDESSPTRILGYHALSVTRITLTNLPERAAKKLPRSAEIGAVLLGKLAVDRQHQRKRLGEVLLFDVFERVAAVNRYAAVYALVVDAIDEEAAAFYEHYEFIRLPTAVGIRLYLPVKDILALVATASR